ncbi:hypothetical protein HDK77DRAFT_121186 [Phyllosticta capitalensis]
MHAIVEEKIVEEKIFVRGLPLLDTLTPRSYVLPCCCAAKWGGELCCQSQPASQPAFLHQNKRGVCKDEVGKRRGGQARDKNLNLSLCTHTLAIHRTIRHLFRVRRLTPKSQAIHNLCSTFDFWGIFLYSLDVSSLSLPFSLSLTSSPHHLLLLLLLPSPPPLTPASTAIPRRKKICIHTLIPDPQSQDPRKRMTDEEGGKGGDLVAWHAFFTRTRSGPASLEDFFKMKMR